MVACRADSKFGKQLGALTTTLLGEVITEAEAAKLGMDGNDPFACRILYSLLGLCLRGRAFHTEAEDSIEHDHVVDIELANLV